MLKLSSCFFALLLAGIANCHSNALAEQQKTTKNGAVSPRLPLAFRGSEIPITKAASSSSGGVVVSSTKEAKNGYPIPYLFPERELEGTEEEKTKIETKRSSDLETKTEPCTTVNVRGQRVSGLNQINIESRYTKFSDEGPYGYINPIGVADGRVKKVSLSPPFISRQVEAPKKVSLRVMREILGNFTSVPINFH